ncbi:DMT family transporter [Pelagibacteraceae bacterium]|jgi:drug/metabolite transporter (DMT)-like permease|nr:DMT family transporter [Pelagibacteraceae bacterium]
MFLFNEDIKLLTQNQIGVLYMVASVICFSIMDICIKWLNYYPIGEVFFARFFIGLFPIFFIIPKEKIFTFYKTKRPGLHAFRAITGSLAIIALFFGLRELPLADVISLTFGGPIFVTIGSILFLSEKVGIKRWAAVILGFAGMLLIVQPAFIELNYYYFSPIIFCIFFACVAISVRSLSKTEPIYRIAIYFTILNCLLGLATLPYGWVMPSNGDIIIFIIMSVCGSVGNLLLTQSYRISEASLVTPIKYLSLVFAIVFGFLIWNEIPKLLTILGSGLVIISSFIIFVRESQLKKKIIAPRS